MKAFFKITWLSIWLLLWSCSDSPSQDRAKRFDQKLGEKNEQTSAKEDLLEKSTNEIPTTEKIAPTEVTSDEVLKPGVTVMPVGNDQSSVSTESISFQLLTSDSVYSKPPENKADYGLLASGLGGQTYWVSPLGDAKQFEIESQQFGVTASLDEATKFDSTFQLPSLGYIGITQTSLFILSENPAGYAEAQWPDGVSEGLIPITVTPGSFYAYKSGSATVYSLSEGKIAVVTIASDLPQTPSGMSKCNQGCDFWMAVNTDLFIKFKDQEGWAQFPRVFAGLTDNLAYQLGGQVSFVDNKIKLSNFIAIDHEANFLSQTPDAGIAEKEATWENILLLSQASCIPCHQNDGFDSEKGFTDRKADILERIKVENKEKEEAMPPWETPFGKEFSADNRALMASWLEKQTATSGATSGGVGMDDMDPNANKAISGALKTRGEANCVSCHADAAKEGWWRAKKGDITSRINSGNMPKNKTLDATERQALIDAFKDI